MSDLATITDKISQLVSRKAAPLSSLEACFIVCEGISEADAKAVLAKLMSNRYLSQLDGDIAQMLAARLGIAVQWSHMPLNDFVWGSGEWVEGRGS